MKISVIIPALNEEAFLPDTIASVGARDGVEVIVVDGGSSDATFSIGAKFADRVLRATAGRASQLNAGARAANGDGFLFLHADTQLPFGGIDAVRECLSNPSIVGGAFRLRLDSSRWPLKVVERAANWRTRLTRIPYGDQAIFVKREVFETLNGFREMEIMEDVDFSRRMKRLGKIRIIKLPVLNSARRWETHGIARTTLANWTAQAMFVTGASSHRIRGVYQKLLSHQRAPLPAQGKVSVLESR